MSVGSAMVPMVFVRTRELFERFEVHDSIDLRRGGPRSVKQQTSAGLLRRALSGAPSTSWQIEGVWCARKREKERGHCGRLVGHGPPPPKPNVSWPNPTSFIYS